MGDELLNPRRCSIHGCADPPVTTLYGASLYAGGVRFCGYHGLRYEALGYGTSREDFEAKQEARTRPQQLHLGEPTDKALRLVWGLIQVAATDDGTVVEGCPSCGVVIPEMVEQKRMIADSERALRVERSRVRQLRDSQNGSVKHNPHYPDALFVWQHWREKIAPGAREFTGKRLKAVLDRLKGGYTPAELCEAVDGYYAFPFQVNGKRERTGSEKDRYQDLELICRDPTYVDKGRALATRAVKYDPDVGLAGGTAYAALLCDCGHPRVHHLPARLNRLGMSPCCEGGCDCMDFDDIQRRADAWLARQGVGRPAPTVDIRGPEQRQRDAQLEIDWRESA